MRGVFLDISKALDKVWNSRLLFKLHAYGVEVELFAILKYYLDNREQRLEFNGRMSDGRKMNSEVPQRSVLGPILFLSPIGIRSICKDFADNISLFFPFLSLSAKELNSGYEKMGFSIENTV